jgi:hypothetical protein
MIAWVDKVSFAEVRRTMINGIFPMQNAPV